MQTKYYKQKQETSKQFDETIEYIISACPILAKEQYIRDMIECMLNYILTHARKWVTVGNGHLFDRVPKSVEASHEGKIIP